jgi:2'-hydroxyisoflavone reductase
MKLLILGGTQFFGRHLTAAALARGHGVTLFNRGRSNPQLFPEAEKLVGDREGNLEALKGRRWDAVVDTCGYVSATVRATAGLLADAVEHYTFVSSVSVYRDFSRSGLDESAPLAKLPDGAVEEEGDTNTYGARKVLCEQAAERAIPGRVLIIRSGVMAGPHDTTERFTHWVRRVARGGDVLSPAPVDATVQLIDARDLAEWVIRMAESRTAGIYNAVGPATPLTFAEMLAQCNSAAGGNARFVWIDEKFLLDRKVKPFSDLPLWIPKTAKSHAGFFAINGRRALDSGLTLRPLVDTARDILAAACRPAHSLDAQNQIGLSMDREKELLQSWNNLTRSPTLTT